MVGILPRFNKFSELCIAKPHPYSMGGAKTFGVPHFVRIRLAERLRTVMVADPTEGYGIFIENMLSAAENQVQPKAA